MNVTHIALIEGGPKPRYRVKQMRFVPHPGTARPLIPQRSAATIDRFADLLAEGLSVTEATRQLGYSGTYGNAMLQRLRGRLGSQAS